MTGSLINPLIIYWDINPSASDDKILSICDELVEAKIFVLDLRDLSSPLSNVTKKVLNRLEREQIKIKVNINKDILGQSMEQLKGLQVFIEFDSLEQFLSSLEEVLEYHNKGYSIGVSFRMHKMSFSELPAFISMCIDNDINNIRIPIQRVDGREIFYPDQAQALMLSEELHKLDMGTPDLSIHDPFLWEMFFKRDNPNEDGCNGAKTMVYISENLDVTPCPIMPVSLGNLQETSLKAIFNSETRRQIREKLSSPPGECASCNKVDKCKGGCRGRTYVLSGKLDGKDPACTV